MKRVREKRAAALEESSMKKRGRPRNFRVNEIGSGQLRRTGVDGVKHRPTSYPPGFAPVILAPASSQHGRLVLGHCSVSISNTSYPTQAAMGITSHSSTLTPDRRVLGLLAETTDGLVNVPTIWENSSAIEPFRTQVSDTLAASYGFPRKQLNSEENYSQLYSQALMAKRGKVVENLINCTAELKDWSIPTAKHLLEIGKLTSTIHQSPGPEKLQPADTSNSIGNGQQENSENNLDQKVEPTQSLSLDISKMAALSNDDSSDPDEVRSAFDAALVTVNGYEVKEEFARVLGDIFTKYGDIAEGSTMHTTRFRSSCLEMVCAIFQKLEGTNFKDISSVELKSMLDRIHDIELERLEVGWLRKRLDEIIEAKLVLKGSTKLKEAKTRNYDATATLEKELDGYKAEIVLLVEKISSTEEKISLTEEKLAAEKAESQTINQKALDTKTKVKSLYQRSLVDGLL